MHRIDTDTRDQDLFGVGLDGFTEGDPSTGEAATQVSDDIQNAWQEEIIGPIEHVGETLDKTDNGQLLQAIRQMASLSADLNYTAEAPPSAKTIHLEAVAVNPANGVVIAVGDPDGVDGYLLTNAGGTSVWVEVTNPTAGAKNFGLGAIAYSPSLDMWAAAGKNDTGVGYTYLITSIDDGVNWIQRLTPATFEVHGMCWDPVGAVFVAVGAATGTDGYILTSADGLAWALQTPMLKNFTLRAVKAGGGIVVAVGDADSTDPYILSSSAPASAAWTEVALPTPRNVTATVITYADHQGPGTWVVIGGGYLWYGSTITDLAEGNWPVGVAPFSVWSLGYDGQVI